MWFTLLTRLAQGILLAERLWAALVLPFLLCGLFVLSAALGLWDMLPLWVHVALLLAWWGAVAWAVYRSKVWRVRLPDAADGRRLIEHRRHLLHRPLTHMADSPTAPLDAQTQPLWARSRAPAPAP